MILPDKCPKCNVDLRKAEQEGKEAMAKGSVGWTRAFLIVQNNRAFSFQCPDCQHEWPMPWQSTPKAVDMAD